MDERASAGKRQTAAAGALGAVDTAVRLLYGHQQDAKVGYNPTKPGRPPHACHSS